MKVLVFTVNRRKLEYEVNETETVLSLKQKIGKDRCLECEKNKIIL